MIQCDKCKSDPAKPACRSWGGIVLPEVERE